MKVAVISRLAMWVCVCVVLFWAAPVAAQTIVPPGLPLHVTATVDPANVDNVCAQIDALNEVCQPVSVVKADGSIEIVVPAVPAGNHVARVIARNVDASTSSDPLPFHVEFPQPAKPAGVKIVVTAIAEVTLPTGQTASVLLGAQTLDFGALFGAK